MQQIESLLRQTIGLDAASVGSPAIERTVRQRLQQLGLKNAAEYAPLLETSPGELDQLVQAVVVTETWFFRDHHPFSACQQAAQEWLARHPARPLRILSVPCSSGEEPYSIAIALLDAAVKPDRFEINAVDISSHALAQAKQGLYCKNSFRGLPPRGETFRDRHFRLTKEGYELSERVRDCVKFHRDNLLAENFHAGQQPYHIIFCRNLLIYFDRATQERALAKLDALLTPGGLLFVGPAELPLLAPHGFANARLPMAFACRKTAAAREIGPPESQTEGKAESSVKPRGDEGVADAPGGHAAIRGKQKVETGDSSLFSTFPISAFPRGIISRGEDFPEAAIYDCWNKIGNAGNGSCAELLRYVHCRNCPIYSAAAIQLLDRPVPAEYRRERTAHYAAARRLTTPAKASVVIFRLEREWLGLPTHAFQEVAEHRPRHSLPHRRGGLVLGLVNVRGELLVCVSLARLLHPAGNAETLKTETLNPDSSAANAETLETSPRAEGAISRSETLKPDSSISAFQHSLLRAPRSPRLLVANWEGNRLVFPVEEVYGVHRVHLDTLREPPATITKSQSAYSRGVFAWRDQTVGLLDAEALFTTLNRRLT